MCFQDTHQIWGRSAKFFSKSKSCSRWGSESGSWFYFGFQYQTYISYIEDTHQILFGAANSFENYCVHMKSPRRDRQTARRTDGRTDGRTYIQTEFFFCLFCLLRHTKHEHSSKEENFVFFTHAITIFSVFTYSVCDEKVKMHEINKLSKFKGLAKMNNPPWEHCRYIFANTLEKFLFYSCWEFP